MSAIDELHARFAQAMLGKQNDLRSIERQLADEVDKTRSYTKSPAGRRALRGFPCVGCGGIGIRQDPLRYLLDVERDSRNRDDV